MLGERPFDIYAGRKMFLGLDFFSRHNPVFLIPYNTLLILLQDNIKRTIAFNLSWIFFSEEMLDLPGFLFSFCFLGKST